MSPDDSSLEKELFYRAMEFADQSARAEFVANACSGNPVLRQRVESLLSTATAGDEFMQRSASELLRLDEREIVEGKAFGRGQQKQPVHDIALSGTEAETDSGASECHDTVDVDPLIGVNFGRFRVLNRLGVGASGNVYLSYDPTLDRHVALKVLHLGRQQELRRKFLREARLVSALDHPNICTLYDVGEEEGIGYIAMQFLEGRTLKELIDCQPLELPVLLSLAIQIADALGAAHQRGVVHRDVKPSNVMVTADGRAKVLDFGVATIVTSANEENDVAPYLVGTPAFMSPEQARAEVVDSRSDIFSLGAVLFHMATGEIPFQGKSCGEVVRAVISEPHKPPSKLNPNLPSRLVGIIDRALSKAAADRYQTVGEMAKDLRSIESVLLLQRHPEMARVQSRRRVTMALIAAALIMMVVSGIAWRTVNIRWARQQVPKIEELARAKNFSDAYDLTRRVRTFIPQNAKLARLLPVISSSLSVISEPPGASVYLRRFDLSHPETSPPRVLLGLTPLSELEIARGDYVINVEKEGHNPFCRTFSGMTDIARGVPVELATICIKVNLTPIGASREGMVFVPGGEYRLVARRPIEDRIMLDDYWIDRCEVTNGEYKDFVTADGYNNEKYWVHPFVKDGRTLSHGDAIQRLTDLSGLPGPRGWRNQTFPEGRENHPVVGITWYEAAAYAAFRGKCLPTIFQWEKAARDGARSPLGVTLPWGLHAGDTVGRANLGGSDTMPVGLLEFGMSPYGCYDMAGNAAEWCRNETSEGHIASGGSWASIPSAWGFFAIYPSFRASNEVGFRCVVNSPNSKGDQGSNWMDITQEIPQFDPEPEAHVKTWLANYNYEKSPLDAHVVQSTDTDSWRSEKIEFTGASGERALAYLYLPKHITAPHQVIHVLPAGDVWYRHRTVPQSIEANYSEFVRSGRAVFSVVLRGNLERERLSGWTEPDSDEIAYVETMAEHVVDLRRGLDYLLSRKDLDSNRIAYMSVSKIGPLMALPAIESRYGAVVFVGDYVGKCDLRAHPAVSGVNLAPLIQGPKLLVHGRYDESAPLKTAAEPLYELLDEPKEKFIFDGGHRPNYQELVARVNVWLDDWFGPVH